MPDDINATLAHIAVAGGGLLQFYVAEDGDREAALLASMMSMIAHGMASPTGDDQVCLVCDKRRGFTGSGGVAIVGASPFQHGSTCVFRMLCAPCCAVTDADLMRAVTDRWRSVVVPTLRVLAPVHEAGRA